MIDAAADNRFSRSAESFYPSEILFEDRTMSALIGRFRQPTDRLTEDDTHEKTAACTAWVWLALYGIAIAGSLLFGPEQQKHETSVATAVSLER